MGRTRARVKGDARDYGADEISSRSHVAMEKQAWAFGSKNSSRKTRKDPRAPPTRKTTSLHPSTYESRVPTYNETRTSKPENVKPPRAFCVTFRITRYFACCLLLLRLSCLLGPRDRIASICFVRRFRCSSRSRISGSLELVNSFERDGVSSFSAVILV